MRKQRGFTLIELLIVVIIIAVLAALIMPRFLSQPEKAAVAEANQMISAIARAQNICVDSGVCTQWEATANFAKIGISAPPSTNFSYACTANDRCVATRAAGTGDYANATVTLTKDGAWTCGGTGTKTYKAMTGVVTGGCTI